MGCMKTCFFSYNSYDTGVNVRCDKKAQLIVKGKKDALTQNKHMNNKKGLL